ncbi:MAG: enoyl-CoA hydratase/isomerase family protein, partial [Planifilum fimeticola]
LRMMDELEEVLREWREDDAIKAVMLTGDRHAFVSGGDLSEFHRLTREEEIYPVMARMGRLLLELQDLGKPTIAAIEGTAVGGGCEIAVSCDFRLASDRARFGFIQVRLGITSGWGGGTRLLSLLKRSDALYLLLTGEVIDSETALRIGLVDRIFPSGEEFAGAAWDFAERVASAPLGVIREYLAIANRVCRGGLSRHEMAELESRSCARLWETPEHRSAVEAFLKKSTGTKKSP